MNVQATNITFNCILSLSITPDAIVNCLGLPHFTREPIGYSASNSAKILVRLILSKHTNNLVVSSPRSL